MKTAWRTLSSTNTQGIKKQFSSVWHSALLSLMLIGGLAVNSQAQIVLNTATGTNYTGGNGVTGNSAVTFVIENTDSIAYLITNIDVFWQTANSNTLVELWSSTTDISGLPSIAAPAWTSVATGGPIAVPTNDYYPTFTNLSIIVPANSVTRYAVQSSTGIRYSGASPVPAPSTFTVGGLSLHSGDHQINSQNIGYGGSFTNPANNPRWFTGSVTLIPAVPCTAPPIAGTTTVGDSLLCPGTSTTASLSGASFGTGQTFQWQSSSDNVTWTNITGETAPSTIVTPSSNTWYRCEVTCSGQSSFSTPQLVTILGPAFSGIITVDPNLPLSATNFTDLAMALNTIGCVGISGPVTINVAAGSGPYNGQVIAGAVSGASATNTITVNGNGAVLEFLSTNGNERATLKLDASSYWSFNNLTIRALGSGTGEFGYCVQLMNESNFVSFDNCRFESSTVSTSTSFAGIVGSNSPTAATTIGLSASHFRVTNSTFIGGYYGIALNGPSAAPFSDSNVIENNVFEDFYLYGAYLRGLNNSSFSNNDISRITQTSLSSFYGFALFGDFTGSVFNANKIHDNATAGSTTSLAYPIYGSAASADATNPFIISNNAVYNINSNGTQYGIYFIGVSDNYRIYHNSIILDHLGHTGSSNIANFYTTSNYSNIELRNNIFYIDNGSSGNQYHIWSSNTSAVPSVSDNNVFWNQSPGGTKVTARLGITNHLSLADWQLVNTNAFDQNSVAANPVFTNTANGDITPLSTAVDNIGAAVGITTDLNGNTRSTTTPDAGAIEFTAVASDLALIGAILERDLCYSSNDTATIWVQNVLGSSLNFATDTLILSWSVTGPFNSSGNLTVNNGTLNPGDTLILRFGGVNMNGPGTYSLSAHIAPNGFNLVASNDSISDITLEIRKLINAIPASATIIDTASVAVSQASSRLMPAAGEPFITEICHFKTGTGAPVNGWPSYLIADDYIEITWAPGADLGGYVLEQWNASGLAGTHTFPSGTLIGPNGTAVVAVGQLGSSVPSPADFYYHGNGTFTSTWGSTTPVGRIIKDSLGNIIDAVVYGNFTFDSTSGVDSTHWSGITPAVSSSGNRLAGPYTKDATNWINSGVSPQDPNELNDGVNFQAPISTPGFSWTLNGVVVDTLTELVAGPFNSGGIFDYVATYQTICGIITDTFRVEVILPTVNPCPVTTSPITTDGVVCGTGTTQLTAVAGDPDAFVIWRDTSGAIRGTGGAFTTDVHNAPFTYTAQDAKRSTVVPFSPGPPTSINTGGFGNFSNGMYITVNDDMVWDSVTLRVNGAVNGTIRVWNANPTEDSTARIIQTAPYSVNGTNQDIQIPVGMAISPGRYYVNLTFSGGGDLWRSTGGAVYPYTAGTFFSIDSAWLGPTSTGNLTRVYYMFDWKVSPICSGPTENAEVTISTPAPTSIPLVENFATALPCNWTTSQNTGSDGWQWGTTTALSSTGFTIPTRPNNVVASNANDCNCDAGDDRLFMPSLDLSSFNASDNLELSFDYYLPGNVGSQGTVLVSTNGTTFTVIDSLTATGTAAWGSHSISLNAQAGQSNVIIAFRQNDNGTQGDGFALDNVSISQAGVTLVGVTFQVDMSRETVSTDGIHIAGNFQGWNPSGTPMTDQGNGIWSVTVNLPVDSTYEFKFINGNQWGPGFDESVPAACAQNGNRFVVVDTTAITTPLVCFGRCEACGVSVFEAGAFDRAIRLYPNPANNEAYIAYEFEQYSKLYVEVYDAFGKVIHRVVEDAATSGAVKLETNSWAAGLYMIRIHNGSEMTSRQLIISR
ncbi:MAG: T9SS type A sorting domain-containing protein [Bacteroidia bacterium]